jgi:uncharacterized protein (DUF302 family)
MRISKIALLGAALLIAPAMAQADGGVLSLVSKHSVPETVARLRQALEGAGMRVSAIIDHTTSAEHASEDREPNEILVLGDPKARTRLMSANPLLALDLPMKVLVWDDEGTVKASFNDPDFLKVRHALEQDEMRYFQRVESLIEHAIE